MKMRILVIMFIVMWFGMAGFFLYGIIDYMKELKHYANIGRECEAFLKKEGFINE